MSRPPFKPTGEQRRMVKSLATIGMPHDRIAVVIGVRSPKTVRKHFRKELSAGFAGAVATVSRVAYEMAASGKYPLMTEYWLSMMSNAPEPADSAETDKLTGTCEMILVPSQDWRAAQQEEVAHASNEI